MTESVHAVKAKGLRGAGAGGIDLLVPQDGKVQKGNYEIKSDGGASSPTEKEVRDPKTGEMKTITKGGTTTITVPSGRDKDPNGVESRTKYAEVYADLKKTDPTKKGGAYSTRSAEEALKIDGRTFKL